MSTDTTEEMKEKVKLPEWLPTPDEASYELTMFDSGGEGIQEISLTREEFLDVKCYVAEKRGIAREISESEVRIRPRWKSSEEETPE